MTTPRPLRQVPIDWQFAIQEQGFTSRYGVSGSDHYRQYLPFGIIDETGHPPKRVDARLYNIARAKWLAGKSRLSL